MTGGPLGSLWNFIPIALLAWGLTAAPTARAQFRCDSVHTEGRPGRVLFDDTGYPHGPRIMYQSRSNHGLPPRLRIMGLNFLNLFVHALVPQNLNSREFKTPAQREGLAQTILALRPHLLVGSEIESRQAMEIFNRDYLLNRYESLLIDGNDGRGIDLGLFVDRRLPVEIEYLSHKNIRVGDARPVLSRDAPVALVYDATANGKATGRRPLVAVIGLHLKSQRNDPKSPDPTGAIRRGREVEIVRQIIRSLRRKYGPDLQIVAVGDMNAKVHEAPELKPLFLDGLRDTLDLVDGAHFSPWERYSHSFFNREGIAHFSQMDAILTMGPGRVTEAEIAPLRDRDARPLPRPRSYEERETQPSDHRPVFTELEWVPSP